MDRLTTPKTALAYARAVKLMCPCDNNNNNIIICSFVSRHNVVTSEAAPVSLKRTQAVPVKEINLLAYLPLVQTTETHALTWI